MKYYIIQNYEHLSGSVITGFNWMDDPHYKTLKEAKLKFKKLNHSKNYYEIQEIFYYPNLTEPLIGNTILSSDDL